MKIIDLRKCNYFIAIVLIILVLVKLLSAWIITDVIYSEAVVSVEDLLKNENLVNGFDVKGNTIVSKNSDPQIFFDYSKYGISNIREITFNIESLNSDKEEIQIYTLDGISNYNVLGEVNTKITEGRNTVIISEDGNGMGVLRLDLATRTDVEMEISGIIVNDFEYMTEIANGYFNCFLYLVVFIILGMLSIRMGTKNYIYSGAGYCVGFLLVLIAAALYFIINDTVLKEIFVMLSALLPLCQIMGIIARAVDKLNLKLRHTSGTDILFAMFLIADIFVMLFWKINLHAVIYLCALYMYGYMSREMRFSKKQLVLAIIYTVAAFAFVYVRLIDFSFESYNINNNAYNAFLIMSDIALGFIAILWYDKIDCTNLLQYFEKKGFCSGNTGKNSFVNTEIFKHIIRLVFMTAALAVTEIAIRAYMADSEFTLGFAKDIEAGVLFVKSTVFFFNLLFIYVLSYLLNAVIGRRTSNLILAFIWVMYLTGNYLKLRFHDNVLQAIDILLIKEIFLIGKTYVGSLAYYGIIAVLVLILILIIIKIKKIIVYLKPQFRFIFTILMIVPVVQILFLLNTNSLTASDVDFSNVWIDEELKFEKEGAVLYSYANIKALIELYPAEPQEYSEEYIKELGTEFDNLSGRKISEVKPDVIVIMAESYFDINQIDEFEFSEDLVYPYREYGGGQIISPRYGGGTAAVEFEALTGFSNMFLLNDVIAYTTYIRNSNDEFPAVPWEFNKNGYETVIMHPNTAEFYNRKNAYKAMGFDEYYSINDFDKQDNVLNDGYYKDSAFGDKLIEIASDDSSPQFIYGITIEGHSPYENKYLEDEINIEVKSDTVEGSKLNEVVQFSQSIKNTSHMIENVIDYVNNTNRPTLLYVFGDHLPPMESIADMDVSLNIWTRYATPLITYSNFKSIDIGSDYITPNQLAAQVLIDAEVEHSSYFDYIYNIRNKYPILKKEFMENMDTPELQKYNMMQYDLMFGERYLLNDE